jgi:hypothetical protein
VQTPAATADHEFSNKVSPCAAKKTAMAAKEYFL